MAGLRPKLGRFRLREKKVKRTIARCAVPDCAEFGEPIMCEKHWPLVSSETRRLLLAEINGLKERGQHTPSEGVRELFRLAIFEVQQALYKAGAAGAQGR